MGNRFEFYFSGKRILLYRFGTRATFFFSSSNTQTAYMSTPRLHGFSYMLFFSLRDDFLFQHVAGFSILLYVNYHYSEVSLHALCSIRLIRNSCSTYINPVTIVRLSLDEGTYILFVLGSLFLAAESLLPERTNEAVYPKLYIHLEMRHMFASFRTQSRTPNMVSEVKVLEHHPTTFHDHLHTCLCLPFFFFFVPPTPIFSVFTFVIFFS